MSGLPTISLPSTGITTSVLGFGCSSLLGPTSRDEALGLLATAYDAGIRHFDVARAYGSGDAERLLGDFIRPYRAEITVTTKLGIRPLPAVADRRFLLTAARRLMRVSPAVRQYLGRQGAKLVKRRDFSPEEAKQSLDTSLRELRIDYVDILLLHDCAPEDCSPELLHFLKDAVATGAVRAFGVGTSAEHARAISDSHDEFAHVLQFAHSALRPTINEVDPARIRAVISHGALTGLDRLRRYLVDNPGVRTEWSQELGVDCGDDRSLAALLLQYAVHTNTRGPVLFSSTRAENIVANTAAIQETVSPRTLARLSALASSVSGSVSSV